MGARQAGAGSGENGIRFGKYRLLRKLGEGAFGSVYEALLPGPMGFTKRVAVKRLRAAVLEDNPKVVQALINEARIGGLLHHGNIVDILEFGEVDGRYYMAMEYVDGPTLGEVIQACRMNRVLVPRFAVIDMAMGVCRGLHHAHTLRGLDGAPLGLIHRDIKPSNLILDAEGRAKILDFGIAKAASNLYATTTSAVVKGTPRYMSPEQVEAGVLSARSDIFSFGVVLYEAITGHLLFTARELAPMLRQILLEDLSDSIAKAEEALPGCGPILSRCLDRNPPGRFSTAKQLGDAMAELRKEYPADADMAEVVARLMNRVASSRSFQVVHPSDLENEETDDWQAPAGPYPEDVEADDEPTVRYDSAWDRFTTVFHDAEWPESTPVPAFDTPDSDVEGDAPGSRRRFGWLPWLAAVLTLILVGAGTYGVVRWLDGVRGAEVRGETGDSMAESPDGGGAGGLQPAGAGGEGEGETEAVTEAGESGLRGGLEGEGRLEGDEGHRPGEQPGGPERRGGVDPDPSEAGAEPGNGQPRDDEGGLEAVTEAEAEGVSEEELSADQRTLRITCPQACDVYLDSERHGSRSHLRTKIEDVDPGVHVLKLIRLSEDGTRQEKDFGVVIDGRENFVCWDFEAGESCR